MFVLGLGFAASAFPVAAMTTVTRDGATVTIHVPIEVEGIAGTSVVLVAAPTQSIDYRTYLQTEAMRIWNEAFSGVKWGDCLQFRLDLQLIPVTAGQHRPGRHLIKLSRGGVGDTWWRDTGLDDQVPTRDFPFAYTRDMEGYWNAPDGATVAHEVGHAMGLGDDYFVVADENEKRVVTGKKAEPELGEVDSHMANHHHAPDSIIVFRIIEQMQEAGVLPSCARDLFTYYQWDGVVKKEFTQQERDELQIDATWSAEFHMKFVQVPTSSGGSYTHKDDTFSRLYVDTFYPVALDYTLVPSYSETMPGDHRIEVGGTAKGRLRRDTLLKPRSTAWENQVPETDPANNAAREAKWIRLPALKGMDRSTIAERLGGEVLRIGGDHPGNAAREERRNSDAEECAFYGDLPGDFRLTIDLASRGNGTENWSDEEQAALLRGIKISGTNLYNKAAEASDVSQFQHLIRADICGRIDRGDQKEVSGSRTFTVAASGGIPAQQGRLIWLFQRTAKRIPYERK